MDRKSTTGKEINHVEFIWLSLVPIVSDRQKGHAKFGSFQCSQTL